MTRSSPAAAAVLLVALAVASLAGCANTVRGVATDVKQTGNAVEDAVR